MQLARIFFTRHWYGTAIIAILLVAAFLRFFELPDRFGLAYDQARDLLVARESIRTLQLPLIGPFASAGQFVYGPQWYWILTSFIFLTPGWFLGPWVALGVLSCMCVYLMIRVGQMIGGKALAVIVGVLIAVSPGGIAQSVNLSSPSMAGVLSIISLFFFVRYIKRKRSTDSFFLAFFISTAMMVHFQAVGLFSFLLMAGILGKRSVKHFLLMVLGFVLPLVPLIYFDLTNNFFESRNMLDYYLYGQQRIYYPNRWLTYLGIFWPNAWARVTGGEHLLGYAGFFGFFIFMLFTFFKKKLDRIALGIASVFLINVILLRYYKGQLFDSYLAYLHGIILILTGLVIFYVYRRQKVIGIICMIVLVLGSLRAVSVEMKGSVNGTYVRSEAVARVLERELPEEKFSVYDYSYMSPQISLPIVLYLDSQGKLHDSGVAIGITSYSHAASMSAHPVIDSSLDIAVLNLSASTTAQLSEDEWGRVNASDVYKSTVLWYRNKEL